MSGVGGVGGRTATTLGTTQTESSFKTGLPLGEVNDANALVEPLTKLLSADDVKYAPFYAEQLAGLGRTFKDSAIKSLEKKMTDWKAQHPNATEAETKAQFRKEISNTIMVQQTFKSHITQMAQQAIDRMRDTFEG